VSGEQTEEREIETLFRKIERWINREMKRLKYEGNVDRDRQKDGQANRQTVIQTDK
jgi:hypothetical protein